MRNIEKGWSWHLMIILDFLEVPMATLLSYSPNIHGREFFWVGQNKWNEQKSTSENPSNARIQDWMATANKISMKSWSLLKNFRKIISNPALFSAHSKTHASLHHAGNLKKQLQSSILENQKGTSGVDKNSITKWGFHLSLEICLSFTNRNFAVETWCRFWARYTN